ncbi:MAG: type I phosphomannose isomerase catalytic subunit [Clostridia bacterium]|nr:type I phosphomannose isomerase catalytic subunit [Clostridia bacterium]
MKPLKLKAVYKDYIWGGEKLRTKYGKDTDMSPLAESWELSCHKDGLSTIFGGEYDGKTLEAYIKENHGCLGTLCRENQLPILIKLIDAADNLSVQVHPNNEQAHEWENQNGKTEMWYVVQADEGSKMTCGVKKDITKTELENAIVENKVEELLNTVPSKKGDVFFVEAGTIHAIGKGNVIAEIQQNSNVTYRLYDYDRRDKNGNPRELHIEKGVKASNCKKTAARKIPLCSDGTRLLGSCEYFAVKEIKLSGSRTLLADEKSYHALMVTEGEAMLESADCSEKMKAGETVFIPAGLGEYSLKGEATVLLTTNQPKYFVNIALEGTNITSEVVDEYGVVYAKASRKADSAIGCEELAECARESASESGLLFDDIDSVKVASLFDNISRLEEILSKKVYIDQ